MRQSNEHGSAATGTFVALVFLLVFAAQVLLYHEAFQVKPAGDDFSPPMADIERGEAEGPASFFLETRQSVYRPLQSTTMWLVGRLSEEHRLTNIHLMTFGVMAFYGFVLLLWVRRLGLNRIGVIVAAVAFFVHPIFAGPLGGVDNFGGILSHALMWLGALAVLHWRDRFGIAIAVALCCMIIGSLYKEYAFGLVPLAALTALVFSRPPQRRWGRALVIGLVLVAFMLTSLIARRYLGAGSDDPRLPFESPSHMVPMIARNAALLAVGTVFSGNTVWVYVERSSAAFGWVLFNAASLVGLVGVGIAMLLSRYRAIEHADNPSTTRPGGDTSPRWVVFLLLSFLAASFPANMIPYEVSEMYVTSLLLPLALLCALAAEGFVRGPTWSRWVAGAVGVAHVVIACLAVTAKVHGLREAGDLAARQLDQLATIVPIDARDQTVTLVFVIGDIPPHSSYSVFRMGPDTAMTNRRSLEYRLPQRGLKVEKIYVDGLSEVEQTDGRLVYRWDHDAGQFVRMDS